MLKQEQQTDMYIEKIYLQKIYRDNQAALDKIGYKKNCAEDLTANQKVKVKVRAVGLDYNNVTKWLEDLQQQAALQKIIRVIDQQNSKVQLKEDEIREIREFLAEFRERLLQTKTDKLLIRLINDHV